MPKPHALARPPAAVSLTVGQLKLLAERLLGVRAARQSLLLLPPGADAGGDMEGRDARLAQGAEDITDCAERPLAFFSVCDGCRCDHPGRWVRVPDA